MTRLIDADAFRKWLCALFAGSGTHEDDTKEDEEWNASLARIITHLDEAPTIEPDRPHGEWIESKERKGHFYCSECVQEDPETGKWRETFEFRYPFCPNCGADMSANDRQVTGKLDENTQKHYGFRKKKGT